MRRILSILFLLYSLQSLAQKPAEPAVTIRPFDSRFQFVHTATGQPVDNLLWDEAEPFVNGFSRVLKDTTFSFVNMQGKLISPVVFENARNFSNKLAAVKKDGKWGFINESGKTVIAFKYGTVFDFNGTVTVVYNDRKWWLVNNKGSIIKPLDISVCYGFKNGIAKITKDDREGILYPDGKIIYNGAKPGSNNAVPWQPNTNNIAVPCPDNIGFELGDFTNWQCYIGQVDSVGTTNVVTVNPSPPTANRHTIYPRLIPSALDPFGLFPTNPPDGSNFAVKLGNTVVGAQAERVSYTIHVPLNDSNFSIKYNYAVVLEDPGHTIWTQPRFTARLLDSATNTYIDCASFEYISTSGLPGFEISPVDASVIFKPWASVFYNLRGYGGQTLYLEFTSVDCVRRGHWGYAYVDVENICGSPINVQYDCTFPNITTLTGPPGFEFYNWWNQDYSILLGTGQQITLNPGPTINSIIWLEMIPYNNFGCKDTLLIRITGDFDAQFDMSAATGCAPQTFTFYNRNLPSLTTLWDFGDGTTGTGDTVTHTYSVPGSYNVTLNVTVPGGCNGSALHLITIYPTPNVVQPPNQVLCIGAATSPVTFTGLPASTIFTWTNNNTAIGLPASGTGDIAAFTPINTGNTPVVATITVTPVHLTCSGTPLTFTITVNPRPNVVQPPDQIICRGATTTAINFSGAVTGTVYNWTNNNTSIGLAAGGSGNIAAFTAINTTNAPITATITVTPVAAGCTGIPRSFTIRVNPTPNVVQPANQILCNGAATNAITFTGAIGSTSYNWVNNNPSIGLAANGNGNIPSFTAINTGNTQVTASITVTPSASGCPGIPETFTITVNPTPNVAQPANQTLCNGATTNLVTFTGSVSNAAYYWVNNNTTIGLGANGNGNIPAFTAVNTGNVPVTATITVTPAASGCNGTPQTFTITVNPTPGVVQPANQTLCNGATTNAIAFSGSVSNTIYIWSNNNTSIGLAAAGNGNIPAFTAVNTSNVPVTATVTVTPSAAGCAGTAQIFTITVNPTPDVVQPANQIICNGATTNAVIFTGSVSGTIFNWTNNNTSIGLAAGGNGNIPAFTAINTTNVAVTATITVTPTASGCAGLPQTFTITINPTPDVIQPANQNLCNGATTNAIVFNGSVSGTNFNWTNNNTSIGLAAGGNGNIPAFTAINTTNAPVIATISVTPSAMGCTGAVQTFTITVNPTPDVAQTPDQVLCSEATTNAVIFSGSVNGTVYNWTNTATTIGLPASGSGNIAPFTAYSNNYSVSVATIRVTPVAFGCTGPEKWFTITVNPTPNVLQPPNQSLCNGATTDAIAFSGAMNNVVYSWTNSNTAIGLAASGIGNIPAFAGVNTGNTPITATITVTPATSLCTGAAKTFTITVHPTPLVNAGIDTKVCLGNSVQLTASGASQYIWSPATGLSCTNCPNPVSTPVDSMRYIVRGESAFGCIAFDTVLLNIIRPFQMLVSPNDTICIGESVDLNASGANSYIWSPAHGLNRTDIAAPTATPTVTTNYRVVGYDGHNCFTDTGYIKIAVGQKPVLDLGPDHTVSTGTIITFNPVIQNGPIVNWSWTPATGLSCTNCPSPVTTAKDNATYMLTVTNNYGCTSTDVISLFVFCKSAQVFIPNAFTPDGDGLNDILMVRGKGIFVKTFRIFNRWGELVFEKTNFNPNDTKYGWDGRVRGIPATPDVFVYTAEVICDNSVIYTYKGNTTLLK
ncbi:MAG TPA: WG repeat-containing protein [Ferruginibacter sp.]|nr:WG repeat-containing protein [Ferruginibacter sp.]